MERILVTGGARGMGLEFVRQYLADGNEVFAAARNADERDSLTELQSEYPDRLTTIDMDVTDSDDVFDCRQMVVGGTDTLDVLVNNAGINSATSGNPASHTKLGHLDPEEMLDMFHVNAIAPVILCEAFLDLLAEADRPRVVALSSRSGSFSVEQGGNYGYAGSKAALNMLMRQLAFDVQDYGITVSVLNPGWVQTRMGGSDARLTPEESVAGMREVIDGLTLEDTAEWLTWDGEKQPW